MIKLRKVAEIGVRTAKLVAEDRRIDVMKMSTEELRAFVNSVNDEVSAEVRAMSDEQLIALVRAGK